MEKTRETIYKFDDAVKEIEEMARLSCKKYGMIRHSLRKERVDIVSNAFLAKAELICHRTETNSMIGKRRINKLMCESKELSKVIFLVGMVYIEFYHGEVHNNKKIVQYVYGINEMMKKMRYVSNNIHAILRSDSYGKAEKYGKMVVWKEKGDDPYWQIIRLVLENADYSKEGRISIRDDRLWPLYCRWMTANKKCQAVDRSTYAFTRIALEDLSSGPAILFFEEGTISINPEYRDLILDLAGDGYMDKWINSLEFKELSYIV